MCGIFGFYLKNTLSDANIQDGIKATKRLLHRGPDNVGYWYDRSKGIFLGHTRLSIIDSSTSSNQPFIKNSTQLVYNGEIYNYHALKKTLQNQNINFETNGDTEVLSELLNNNIEKNLNSIDGMFSFAFYKKGVLFLAIDSFGEKPLYWYESKKGFYFSSEPEPLVKMLKLDLSLHNDSILDFLVLGYIPSPDTAYNGLYRCEPSTLIRVTRFGGVKLKKYWSYPTQHVGSGLVKKATSQQLDDITQLLIDSLARRTISDVPVGLFLSSGVDSSLIAALLCKELNRDDILAFTVAYDKKLIHDESIDAARIAKYLNMRHITVNSDQNENDHNMDDLHMMFGEPNSGLTAFSVEQMSHLAKRNFGVALSGTGGDELFFGYGKYNFLYKYRYFLTSKLARSVTNKFLKNIADISSRLKTIELLTNVNPNDVLFALKDIPYFSDHMMYKVFRGYGDRHYDNITAKNIVLRQRTFDLSVHMPNMIIPAMERGSMKASLEVRTPFLSKDLIKYTSELDYRTFVKFGQKNVLRSILGRYIPPSITSTPKRGFSFPVSRFINSSLPTDTYFDNKMINYVLNKNNVDSRWGKVAVRLLMLNYYNNIPSSSIDLNFSKFEL
mgnify:FL=1